VQELLCIIWLLLLYKWLLQQFAKSPLHPVMIISYEMFLRNVDVIKKLNFDLLVCDEGHRLKNTSIKTSLVCLFVCLSTTSSVNHA